jgi:hypothetical protein
MGEIWWHPDKISWKKSKAQGNLYTGIYYYLYGHNPYTARDITADPLPRGIMPN